MNLRESVRQFAVYVNSAIAASGERLRPILANLLPLGWPTACIFALVAGWATARPVVISTRALEAAGCKCAAKRPTVTPLRRASSLRGVTAITEPTPIVSDLVPLVDPLFMEGQE